MALPSNPLTHIRSEDVVTDPVSTWPDQSGNGNDFVQGSSTLRPVLVADELNGFQVVRFDGSDDTMYLDAVQINQPLSMVVVCRSRDIAQSDQAPCGMAREVFSNNLGPTPLLRSDEWQMFAGGFASSAIAQDTDWHVVIAVFDDASSTLDVDSDSASLSPGSRDGRHVRVGSSAISAAVNGGNPDYFWDGDIAEFLFYSRALNSTEIADTLTFFDDKYFTAPPPQFDADLAEEVDEAFDATFETGQPFFAELAEEVDEALEATLQTTGTPPGGAFDTNVTVIVEIAPGDGPLTASPTWVPVADFVRGASWTRGRSSVQSDFPAGRGRVLLDNSDGRFYSWNTASPYFPDITVGVPIRIRAIHDSVIYDLFRGYVSRWPWEFPTNSEELAVAEMVETYTRLEGKKVSGSYAAASTDARIDAVLDSAGWPGGFRDLDSGIADVAAITASSESVLSLLRQAEEAEQGQVFQGADGALVMRNRVASSGASSQATFGPDGVELIYTDVTATEDDDLLWNEARVTGSDGVEQEASDATSITKRGPRTYDSTNPSILGPTGALNVAEWVVGKHADILRRITGLEIDPGGDPDNLWPEVLGRELRDVVTVEVSFPGSTTQLSQPVAIESVSHSFEVGGVWTVAYGCHPLSDLEQSTFFTIGVSQLDGTHILG